MDDERRRDEDFSDIEGMLRGRRHRPTALDLDRIKLEARARAARRPASRRVGALRPGARLVTLIAAVGLVVSGAGAAAAMSGKVHVFRHHKTASAAWFQYKPPCPPGKQVKMSKKGAHASWKHDPCKPHKPPPPPPCGTSKTTRGGSKGCPPPPCSSTRGATHGCSPSPCSLTRGNQGCSPVDNTPTTQAPTFVAPVTTITPSTPNLVNQPVKHKAKKHKAKKKAKHRAKKHRAKKHAAKKHSSKRR
jgi:hypothetical protein